MEGKNENPKNNNNLIWLTSGLSWNHLQISSYSKPRIKKEKEKEEKKEAAAIHSFFFTRKKRKEKRKKKENFLSTKFYLSENFVEYSQRGGIICRWIFQQECGAKDDAVDTAAEGNYEHR